jgi:hypothetical protein
MNRRSLRCVVYGLRAVAAWTVGASYGGHTTIDVTTLAALALGVGIALYQEWR